MEKVICDHPGVSCISLFNMVSPRLSSLRLEPWGGLGAHFGDRVGKHALLFLKRGNGDARRKIREATNEPAIEQSVFVVGGQLEEIERDTTIVRIDEHTCVLRLDLEWNSARASALSKLAQSLPQLSLADVAERILTISEVLNCGNSIRNVHFMLAGD